MTIQIKATPSRIIFLVAVRNSRNKLNQNDLIFILDGPYHDGKDNTVPCLVWLNSVKEGLSPISFCMLRTVSFIKVDRPQRLHVLAA